MLTKSARLRLYTLAHTLASSGDTIDGELSAWLLGQEKSERQRQGQRVARVSVPRAGGHVKVKLKCGAWGYVPAQMVKDALERESET